MNCKIIVLFDNWCPNCTKVASLIKKIDWLKLIEFQELRNDKIIQNYNKLDKELACQQMASYNNGIWVYGFSSIFQITKRLPILWLAIPFFYVLKLTGFGQFLYKQLAIKRKIIPLHCDMLTCEIQ
jgi:predicted DCC family thiol-disulfide oxidoreductase YuxK